MLRRLALAAIRGYQRYLSPHKGFCCAYRLHTGHSGCSELGFRAIRLHGLLRGGLILRQRLWLCGVVYRRHAGRLPGVSRAYRSQAGFCDVGDCGVSDCDLPGIEMPSFELPSFDLPDLPAACDRKLEWATSCADCGDCGDCGRLGRRPDKHDDEATIYIPPHSGRH